MSSPVASSSIIRIPITTDANQRVHAHLPGRVFDIDRWEVLDLVLREVELNALIEAGNRADRNRYFLSSPKMTLLEQDMAHVMRGPVDDQSLDLADLAISGVDLLTSMHSHLA